MRYTRYSVLVMLLVGSVCWSADGWAQQKKGEESSEKSKEGEGEEEAEGEDGDESATKSDPSTSLQRGSRMEFDGRLIRGQHAGAGAVFLFERVPRQLPSMIDKRRTYLRRTVHQVLGQTYAVTFDEARKEAADERERADTEDSSEDSDE